MSEIFGNYDDYKDTEEYLILSFSAQKARLKDIWGNNSLSANFLASFWGNFFPLKKGDEKMHQTEIKDSISFIANELLENALKYNHAASHIVKISLSLNIERLNFYVSNIVDPRTINDFKNYIQTLLKGDPGELFIRQLELNAEDDDKHDSRLGYLTLLNDYDADLGWKFEEKEIEGKKMTMVTTMAQMKISRHQ